MRGPKPRRVRVVELVKDAPAIVVKPSDDYVVGFGWFASFVLPDASEVRGRSFTVQASGYLNGGTVDTVRGQLVNRLQPGHGLYQDEVRTFTSDGEGWWMQ